MIEHPKAEELVEAVSKWIDSVRPSLPPRDAFLARVAVNVLGVVQRELALGPAAEANAVRRLRDLLGQEGDFQALNAQLCEAIRSGEMGVETPGLLAALKANITEQIAIDQPNYVSVRPAT
ncbi:DUF6285 domain-containing protein [Phenylobacterium aquaticum]|uniref:DUF6285 domain-containing protein n=1 Tax=Phenylobacterium aquaticum TaxID=1763816 RepID=UPI001F5D4846|nr:DUF6285 domain-containing protein [Phenylobacterium aquaticum]